MSVYTVTKDNRLLRYSTPNNQQIWLADNGTKYHIYWKNCCCDNCTTDSHKVLVAYVDKSTVVSIGFERPVSIEGRMLTFSEREQMRLIADWLTKNKKTPRKLKPEMLRSVAKLTERIY